MYQPYTNIAGALNPTTPPFIAGTSTTPLLGVPSLIAWPPVNPQVNPNTTVYNLLTQTFAHEGRMPPLINDNIFDANHGLATTYLPGGVNSPYLTANGGTYNNGNVGDNGAGVVRLRRVWDSWSTTYSQAPGTGPNASAGGFPWGYPFQPPIYPSYPAPYQAPLRGIQIQIRAADPTNQRIKSLTIREDFTDKL